MHMDGHQHVVLLGLIGAQAVVFRQMAQLAHDMTGWYQRWENNGWRPIADRWFVDPEATARQQKAEAQQQWFHYCPKVRRQEREAASKQRKRLWMSKIYRLAWSKHNLSG